MFDTETGRYICDECGKAMVLREVPMIVHKNKVEMKQLCKCCIEDYLTVVEGSKDYEY